MPNVHYARCSEVEVETVYKGFKAGFADYVINIEMPYETFTQRFFGPEGNSMDHSFIALNEDQPIGVVLGGIREMDDRQTMRCGAMCVVPDYRMRGVSVELFRLHQEDARNSGCRQMCLEVIASNTPAVKFYKRIGYRKIYDLLYYFTEDIDTLKQKNRGRNYSIDEITISDIRMIRAAINGLHINWQNEIDYFAQLQDQYTYGIRSSGSIVAALCINKSGAFHFLNVNPNYRENGMATALLLHSVQQLGLQKIKTSTSNNAAYQLFLAHNGFTLDKITQYEMYLAL